jgi:drug/metabolite transporter (DMT)-like permease
MQQKLRALLNTNGANFVRYFYGAPISLGMLAGLVWLAGYSIPELTPRFLFFVTLGGLAQIVATSLLITAFNLRNFAVGTVYSKTEIVQLAIFQLVVLHEGLSFLAWIGIGVCLAGVIVLSLRGSVSGIKSVLADLTHKAALIGMAAGTLFAVAAGSIRVASLALPEGDWAIRGITTLAVMNTIQTVLMGGWLLWRDRDQVTKVVVFWRSSLVVGILSVLGSAGWALAMTLHNAAMVRALGQVELIFTFIASRFLLHERPTMGEIFGSALVAAGVVLVLLGR